MTLVYILAIYGAGRISWDLVRLSEWWAARVAEDAADEPLTTRDRLGMTRVDGGRS